MQISTEFCPEKFKELRGLAFSNECECLRRLIALIHNIMCDLEFLEFEIDELKKQEGEKNE